MARLNRVNKARKAQGQCYKCGTAINAGDSYTWWANRIGRMSLKKKVCSPCSGNLRRSDYATTSSHKAAAWDAQDDAEDSVQGASCASDIVQALEDCRDAAQEVQDGYQESLDNLPESFQESSPIVESIDACETWVSELDTAADDIRNAEEQDPETDEDDDDETKLDEWKNTASDAVQSLEL